ncbi:UMF1 family MFS transporter [Sedimentibacter acidaminivorans]|uniref:UMF1 family MFS transporter n=1 Tax=Sedimentibacter acidaminivorans TaxID=913099 RepID=A0ABS4GAV0_9FIRM|nr:MFS transporter [Sedimentibacter acidaminivorans]MBP1924818.1 UMF1 family MFS transporter [Sedimentibacter acidaminivorans]
MNESKIKLTKLEKYWILYDVGNSAFILLVSTIIPIYFKNIAMSNGISAANSTAYWSYAISISTLVVAILGPILGTLADTKGYKKPLFILFLMLGVLGCAALSLPFSWIAFLTVFVFAKVGISGSFIFYDSMLSDITTDDKMDYLSSLGYAWGYIGSCIPFTISLILILFADKLNISTTFATSIAFILNSAWWFIITIPLLRNYNQIHYIEVKKHAMMKAFKRLWDVFKDIKNQKEIFTYLLAFFFYIDGVYTIIEMATSYGKDVGIGDNDLLLALLLTQVVAFPFAIIFGRLSKKFKTKNLINVCIIGYFLIALFALQLDKTWEFWFLAVCVAIFQGGIQAFSRSYFAKIIPKEKSSEYFGLYDIFGKGASFIGALLMGISTQISGNSKTGVAFIGVMFIIGFIVFQRAVKIGSTKN